MKLINLDHSPYAARVRMQIRKKGLPIEFIPPPYNIKTPEFKERFILGKVPLLQLSDGSYLPESVAIMEYLEDLYPDQPMRPNKPLDKARMRVLMSFTDTHFAPALFPLFRSLIIPAYQIDPLQQIAALRDELDKLNRWLATDIPLSQRAQHLGDLTLAPTLWFAIALLPLFDESNILSGFDRVQVWWQEINDDQDIHYALQEMETGFQGFTESLKSSYQPQ